MLVLKDSLGLQVNLGRKVKRYDIGSHEHIKQVMFNRHQHFLDRIMSLSDWWVCGQCSQICDLLSVPRVIQELEQEVPLGRQDPLGNQYSVLNWINW